MSLILQWGSQLSGPAAFLLAVVIFYRTELPGPRVRLHLEEPAAQRWHVTVDTRVDDGWRFVGVDEDCPTGALRIHLSAEVIGLITNAGVAPGAALDFTGSLIEPGQRWNTTAQLTAGSPGLSALTLPGRSTEAMIFSVMLSTEGPNIKTAIGSLVEPLGDLTLMVAYKANKGWRSGMRQVKTSISIPRVQVADALKTWAVAHAVSETDWRTRYERRVQRC